MNHLATLGFVLLALLIFPTAVSAQSTDSLDLQVDMQVAEVKVGDTIFFNTTVSNNDTSSVEVIAAMNIINLGDGQPVDPEDWSPRRSQNTGPLAPGANATQRWEVNAIVEGDYMVYIVAVPTPDDSNSTSYASSTYGIHLTVDPHVRLNPMGILYWSIGIPALVGVFWLGLRQYRKMSLKEAGETE